MFHVARSSPRIKRLYVYTWFGAMTPGFDAGLVVRGHKRPAYAAFRANIRPTAAGAIAR